MRTTPVKYILLMTAVTRCFVGCQKERADETQSEVRTETAVDGEQENTEETYTIYNYDYTGYEDECTGWSGYKQFVDQDYDNDKLIDEFIGNIRKTQTAVTTGLWASCRAGLQRRKICS